VEDKDVNRSMTALYPWCGTTCCDTDNIYGNIFITSSHCTSSHTVSEDHRFICDASYDGSSIVECWFVYEYWSYKLLVCSFSEQSGHRHSCHPHRIVVMNTTKCIAAVLCCFFCFSWASYYCVAIFCVVCIEIAATEVILAFLSISHSLF